MASYSTLRFTLLGAVLAVGACSSTNEPAEQNANQNPGAGGSTQCELGSLNCPCTAAQLCNAPLTCSASVCITTASTGGAPSNVGGTTATGGQVSSGGTAAGGSPAGGAMATGGSATGGASTGGTSTDTGGTDNGSGGSATGGSATIEGLTAGACTLGAGTQEGEGNTDAQYEYAEVKRDGVNYGMITNGWGSGWNSHNISWLGTSLAVNSYDGDAQSNGAPAGYPSVFCGQYSDKISGECGLPKALSAIVELNTAVSWSHESQGGTYNVAFDVWLGDGNAPPSVFGPGGLESYFMVWLHNPIGEGPAGNTIIEDVIVPGIDGTWNIHHGEVNGLPIVNYVRPDGEDSYDIAFDMMVFIKDAQERNLTMPGADVLSVAIGFEIWDETSEDPALTSTPLADLLLNDFCVDAK